MQAVQEWQLQEKEKQLKKRTWDERKKGLTRPRTKVFYLTEEEFESLTQYLKENNITFQSLILEWLYDEGII